MPNVIRKKLKFLFKQYTYCACKAIMQRFNDLDKTFVDVEFLLLMPDLSKAFLKSAKMW